MVIGPAAGAHGGATSSSAVYNISGAAVAHHTTLIQYSIDVGLIYLAFGIDW